MYILTDGVGTGRYGVATVWRDDYLYRMDNRVIDEFRRRNRNHQQNDEKEGDRECGIEPVLEDIILILWLGPPLVLIFLIGALPAIVVSFLSPLAVVYLLQRYRPATMTERRNRRIGLGIIFSLFYGVTAFFSSALFCPWGCL